MIEIPLSMYCAKRINVNIGAAILCLLPWEEAPRMWGLHLIRFMGSGCIIKQCQGNSLLRCGITFPSITMSQHASQKKGGSLPRNVPSFYHHHKDSNTGDCCGDGGSEDISFSGFRLCSSCLVSGTSVVNCCALYFMSWNTHTQTNTCKKLQFNA